MKRVLAYYCVIFVSIGLILSIPVLSLHFHEKFSNNTLDSLLIICDSLLNQGNTKEANNKFFEAESALKGSDSHLFFRFYFQKGRYYSFMGENNNAIRAFYLARNYSVNLDQKYTSEIGLLFKEIGAFYFRINDFSNAILNFQQALNIAEKAYIKNEIDILGTKICLANSYWNNCEIRKATETFRECQSHLNEIKDPNNIKYLDIYLGIAEYYLYEENRFNLSEKYLNSAAIILKQAYPGNHFKFGIMCSLKGLLNYKKQDYENALHYINQSEQFISLFTVLKRYHNSNNRCKASILFFYNHDYNNTISYSNNILSKTMNTGDSPSFFYYITGRSYFEKNNVLMAAKSYQKAIQSSTVNTTLDRITRFQTYYHYSKLYSPQNEPDKVLNYLRKSLEEALSITPRSREISWIYKEIGLFYYYREDYKNALEYIQQSIIAATDSFSNTSVFKNPPAKDIRPVFSIIEALSLKANALVRADTSDLRYLESALQCTELGVQLIEQWLSEIDEENAGLSVTSKRKRTMNNAVYYASQLYLKTGNRIYAEKALAYAEKSKMQVLMINTSKRSKLENNNIPDSLIQQAEKINNSILDLENQLVINERKGKKYLNKKVTEFLTHLNDEKDALHFELIEKYPRFNESRYEYAVEGINEIQKSLKQDQVIIEYQLLMNQIISFVLLPDTFYIKEQLIDSVLRMQIETLRNAISEDPINKNAEETYKSFISSSHYLYRILIEPIYYQIRDKRLVIIPHNELTLIPFEVLISKMPLKTDPINYSSLPYLIKEFPLSYAYSANFLLDKNSNHFGKGTAVFLPDYDSWNTKGLEPTFQELAGAKSEAKLIKKISGGRLYSGINADEQVFKKKAGKYRVLHISSHALVDEQHPNLSYLVMNLPSDTLNDGYLYAFELRQLVLNAQLVVLSGCNTGFGRLNMNEGLISLARSFFYTGVRSIAITLWPVSDNAGSKLIASFYEGLKRGKTLDIAMKNAKMDFIYTVDPVKTHPYYWANYMILGKIDPVTLTKYPLWMKIISVSLILVILSVIFYKRFKA